MVNDEFKQALLKADFGEILGNTLQKDLIKSALLVDRHVVIIGPPGVGKTTIAKNVADLLPGDDKHERFVRVQGSPDLTAEDLMGDIDPIKAMEFGPLSKEAFTPGKIFKADKGVLFFDELNRAPEKLQNALLQVLAEKKATIGSYDVDFDANFILIATMNPEDSSTEKLSDVLLDRFDVVYMSYPESAEIESHVVRNKGTQICEVSDELVHLMVQFVRSLRQNKNLEKHPSVRATLGLYERAQAHAKLMGRDKATLADMDAIVDSVISHRIKLKPSVRLLKSVNEFVRDEYEEAKKKVKISDTHVEDPRERKGGSIRR